MRRITSIRRWGPKRTDLDSTTIATRDYRLMCAVVKAAGKWAREKGHIDELANAVIAFNAPANASDREIYDHSRRPALAATHDR